MERQSSDNYDSRVGNPASQKPIPGNTGAKVGGGKGTQTGGGKGSGTFPGVQGDPFK